MKSQPKKSPRKGQPKRGQQRRQPRTLVSATKPEWNGTTFASKFEVDYAKQLTDLGLKWEYEPDSFYWFPNPRIYKPDFKITKENGEVFYIETKGFFDPGSRAKMAAIRKQFPDVDIRMAFMDPTKKISKSASGKTYSKWAEAAGYQWSSFCVPKDWRNVL